MPQDDEEMRDRARRKGRRSSISAECSLQPGDAPTPMMMRAAGMDSNTQSMLNEMNDLSEQQWRPQNPPTSEEQQVLKQGLINHFLFSSIKSAETWSDILSSMERKDVAEGDTIVEQNSLDADFLFVVHSGVYGVWLNGVNLEDVKYTDPGSCFGELALMYQCPRQATVKCTNGPGVLWMLNRLVFKRMLMKNEQPSIRGQTFIPYLKKHWVFKTNLTEIELEKVADVMSEESFKGEKTCIIAQHDAGFTRMKFYVIMEGSVEVVKDNGRGRIRVLSQGDYFGERSILERNPRTASVYTITPHVRVATMDWSNFDRLLRKPCLKGFIKQIENGYARTRFAFIVDDERFGTNVTCLAGKRFRNLQAYYSFMKANSSLDDDLQQGFWVTDERYPSRLPNLIGRSFPNIETYVAYLNEASIKNFVEGAAPSSSSSPVSSPAAGYENEKALAIAKKRGRRGSVSGEPTNSSATGSAQPPNSPPHSQKVYHTQASLSLNEETELRQVLQKHFLFADLDDGEFSRVCKELVQIQITPGDYVIQQDDTNADYFYIVKDGEFHVEKDGKLLDGIVYGKNSSFGELALMYMCPRAASVKCVSSISPEQSTSPRMRSQTTTGAVSTKNPHQPKATVYAIDRELFRSILIGNRSQQRDRHEEFLTKHVSFLTSKESVSKVADVTEELVFEPNETIIEQSDADFPNMRLYFVYSGSCDVFVDGNLVRTIDEGGYFGERAIIDRIPRTATVKAHSASTSVRCLALDVPAFERLLGPFKEVFFRNKFHLYVDESIKSPSQHNLYVSVRKGLNGKGKPDRDIPTGWFRVGQYTYPTNIIQLNCKVFRDVQEYHRKLSKIQPSSSPQGFTGDGVSDQPSMPLTYFAVQGRAYPTRMPNLIGKAFPSAEAYYEFLTRV